MTYTVNSIKIFPVMKRPYLFCVILIWALSFPAGACRAANEPREVPEWLERINLGLDAGTGQKPTVYFETVQPLYQDLDKQDTFFIQPRYSLLENDSAYNLGLGYRKLLNDNSILLGANSFFDYEDDNKHYRIGFGTESFINQLEMRTNYYIGLSPRRIDKRANNSVTYEKAVDGLDGEIGLPLPYVNWIKVYAAGYWYNYEKFKNKEGWWMRNEITPFKNTTINLVVWDDNKGDKEFRVDARIAVPFEFYYGKRRGKLCNIGFSSSPYPDKADHSDKTLRRVERQYKIEVEKWSETGNTIVEVKRGN